MLRRLGLALTLVLAVSACSGPPTKERQQAGTALDAAKAADAATYAPDDLAAAEAALAKYDSAVSQRDYRQALNFALQARDHAYDAVRNAGEQETALQTQAQTLLTDLDALIKTANTRLAAGGPHVMGPAGERLRAAERAGLPALQEARTLVNRKQYQAAVRRLNPVIDALRRELPSSDAGRRGRTTAK